MTTTPPPNPDPFAQLEDLKKEVVEQGMLFKAETDSIREQLKLSKEIGDLRTDYEKTLGAAKLLASLASIVVAIIVFLAGLVGYERYKAFEQRTELRLESELDENIKLLKAYTFMAGKQYDSAIELLKTVSEHRPYDPTVLAPLLLAYDETENWEDGESAIRRMEKNEKEASKINDRDLLNNIAILRIEQGVEDPQKLANGIQWLKKSERYTSPGDADSLTNMNVNFWMAALAKPDLEEARVYASRIAVPDSSISLDPWFKVRNWRFFRVWLKKNPKWEPEVKRMWIEQRDRLQALQKGGPLGHSATR